jgi:rare lipoprotein A
MPKATFFVFLLLALLFLSACSRMEYYPSGGMTARCNPTFGAYVQFCNSPRPLSNQVQDGSLVAIEGRKKTVKVAVYYDRRYTLCLPKTYERYFYPGELVKVVTLRCGYSKNKPVCPWSVKVGYASWYGYGDGSGKYTASGRPFKPESYGLANRELPFGTLVKITNLENGRSVYAVVLDRGPFVEGRDFALYPKTMRALGGIKRGVIPVRVEVVRCGWPVY